MSLATFPLIAWGTPDDINAYTSFGSVGVTTGVSDPFGGTSAVTLDDDTAGSTEAKYKTVAGLLAGSSVVRVFAKQGTATVSDAFLNDETNATGRGVLRLTWSGGVPTASIPAGNAVAVTPVAVGDGWYFCGMVSSGVVAGASHRLYLYGASSSAASTGTTSWYVRNAVLLDYVDDYRRFADKRPGYAVTESGSGVRDAWDQGTNYVRRGTVQWVPPTARSTPAIVSGFTGANESTGVNCGVQAMLLAGMQMTSMVWVPDRSACSVNQSVYLTQPTAGWEPTQQPNGDFAFPLELVSASAPGGVA